MNLKLGRKATLNSAGIGVTALLGWLAARLGPLAPAKVTVAKVIQGPLVASTFGIGTVEARRGYALRPTVANRVRARRSTVVGGQAVVQVIDPASLVPFAEELIDGLKAAARATIALQGSQVEFRSLQFEVPQGVNPHAPVVPQHR